MASVKVVLNSKGIADILRSEKVRADLDRRAKAIARAAGAGMVAESRVTSNRARAGVRTDTAAAKRAEARERRLSKAIDAGRA